MYKRKIHELGRVVLPADVRQELGLTTGETVQISRESNKIILHRARECCKLCGADEQLVQTHIGSVCTGCIRMIQKL